MVMLIYKFEPLVTIGFYENGKIVLGFKWIVIVVEKPAIICNIVHANS